MTLQRRIVRRAPIVPGSDWPEHVPMLLRRLYAMRGAASFDDAQPRLARLHAPDSMGGMDAATALLADAIARESPATNNGHAATADPLRDRIIGGELRLTALLLVGVVGLVLLMCCATCSIVGGP